MPTTRHSSLQSTDVDWDDMSRIMPTQKSVKNSECLLAYVCDTEG